LVHCGCETEVAAKVTLALEPGDVLIVQTPGGGGYGSVAS
jgi:N-methylhydantoinase B/oxoprolinase/acetone carboxylase alpha subunit